MQPLIVTAAIIRQDGDVLLTRRLPGAVHGGRWEFPGGKLNDSESPSDCVKREIEEELGLDVEVGPVFEVSYYRYDQGPVLILSFECRILSGKIRHIGVSDHRWVPPGALDQYDILPADAPIVAKLAKSVPSPL